jgi:uncharacterized integral membrane protein (TIGR00697 family)
VAAAYGETMIFFNELIFFGHALLISSASLIALRLGASALISFVSTCCILANLFVIKQVTLLGLSATGSDAFTIGAVLGLNMLQEYYGKQSARSAIAINFFLLVFYAIMSQIHLAYIPSSADIMHQHFSCICSPMPRIVIASFTVYLITQYCDYLLYGFLKTYWKNRFLLLRNYASLIVTQLLDTVLFTILGLYGLVDNVFNVMVISYAIKICAITITTPFISLSRIIPPQK